MRRSAFVAGTLVLLSLTLPSASRAGDSVTRVAVRELMREYPAVRAAMAVTQVDFEGAVAIASGRPPAPAGARIGAASPRWKPQELIAAARGVAAGGHWPEMFDAVEALARMRGNDLPRQDLGYLLEVRFLAGVMRTVARSAQTRWDAEARAAGVLLPLPDFARPAPEDVHATSDRNRARPDLAAPCARLAAELSRRLLAAAKPVYVRLAGTGLLAQENVEDLYNALTDMEALGAGERVQIIEARKAQKVEELAWSTQGEAGTAAAQALLALAHLARGVADHLRILGAASDRERTGAALGKMAAALVAGARPLAFRVGVPKAGAVGVLFEDGFDDGMVDRRRYRFGTAVAVVPGGSRWDPIRAATETGGRLRVASLYLPDSRRNFVTVEVQSAEVPRDFGQILLRNLSVETSAGGTVASGRYRAALKILLVPPADPRHALELFSAAETFDGDRRRRRRIERDTVRADRTGEGTVACGGRGLRLPPGAAFRLLIVGEISGDYRGGAVTGLSVGRIRIVR